MLSRSKRVSLLKQKVLKEQLLLAFNLIKMESAAKKIQKHVRKSCILQRGFVVL